MAKPIFVSVDRQLGAGKAEAYFVNVNNIDYIERSGELDSTIIFTSGKSLTVSGQPVDVIDHILTYIDHDEAKTSKSR